MSKFAEKAEYQKAQTGAGESQLEMVRRIHFGLTATGAESLLRGDRIEYLSNAL